MTAFIRNRFLRRSLSISAEPKKHRGSKWHHYEVGFQPPQAQIPSIDELESTQNLSIALRTEKPDCRKCEFCSQIGDGDPNGPGRLLNLDMDKWVHLNCALWSDEVYETLNGALINVEQSFKRSVDRQCVHCGALGASVTCFQPKCPNRYHLPCALLLKCLFQKDKTLLCPTHRLQVPDPDTVLLNMAVYRRVYINRDETAQVANAMRFEDSKYALRVGSLVLFNTGQLLPHQV